MLAVSLDGDAQWIHLVDVCGIMSPLAAGGSPLTDELVLYGFTRDGQSADPWVGVGAWLRTFE